MSNNTHDINHLYFKRPESKRFKIYVINFEKLITMCNAGGRLSYRFRRHFFFETIFEFYYTNRSIQFSLFLDCPMYTTKQRCLC